LGSISIYDTFLAPPTLKQYMVNWQTFYNLLWYVPTAHIYSFLKSIHF
jgi:hypothetical protein